jgi:hypothetical protein
MTTLAKKATTILLVLLLLLFIAYKPYSEPLYADTLLKEIFILYSFILNQTLGMVHESGHGVCYIAHCPEFITAINGTVFQLLFPFLLGFISKKRGNIFGFYIGLFFLGFSMQYTSWYISTAHEGLHISAANSFLGIDGYHDFNYILSTFGLINFDWLIGGIVKTAGYLLMFYACFKMIVIGWIENSK